MTTPKIDPETVAEMLDGVTPGPWTVVETEHPWHLPAVDQRPEMRGSHIERRIFTTWEHGQLKSPVGVVNGASGIDCSHMVSISAEDACFIAWAREAVPALAARVAELESLLQHGLQECAKETVRAEAAEAKLAAKEAEVEMLRKTLQAIAETPNYPSASWMQDIACAALQETKK